MAYYNIDQIRDPEQRMPSPDLDRAISRYFDLKREAWAAKTLHLNTTILNLFRQYIEDECWPPSKETVLDWLHTVRHSTNPHGKPVSDATVNTYWRHLRAFLNFCEAEGLIHPDLNPAREIALKKLAPKPAKKLPVAFPERDLIKLLSYLSERANGDQLIDQRCIRDYAMILFAYVTGCRVGEILSLTLADLNLAERKALIQAETTKTNRDRFVGFDDGVAEAITRWLEFRRDMQSVAPNLFLSYGGRTGRGQPLKLNSFNLMLRRHLKAVGIPHGKAHKLRHNAALAAIKAGVNLRDVQAQLGHQSIRTTEAYLRLANEDHLESFRTISLSDRLNGIDKKAGQ